MLGASHVLRQAGAEEIATHFQFRWRFKTREDGPKYGDGQNWK